MITRLITYLTISILAFGPSASTFVFLATRASIRNEVESEIKRGIERALSVQIRVKAAEIDTEIRFVRDDEFYYRGELYDVISRKRKGEYVFFEAVPDEKEKALVEKYLDSSGSEPLIRTSHNFKLPGFFHFTATTNSGYTPEIINCYSLRFASFEDDALDREQAPESPPPETVYIYI